MCVCVLQFVKHLTDVCLGARETVNCADDFARHVRTGEPENRRCTRFHDALRVNCKATAVCIWMAQVLHAPLNLCSRILIEIFYWRTWNKS
jgi:hypothetical protein